VGDDLVDLIAAGRGDLEAAQAEAMAHPQPVGLELQEAFEVRQAAARVRRLCPAPKAPLRVRVDPLAVDVHGVGRQRSTTRAAALQGGDKVSSRLPAVCSAGSCE
jgi:hypothetical protein